MVDTKIRNEVWYCFVLLPQTTDVIDSSSLFLVFCFVQSVEPDTPAALCSFVLKLGQRLKFLCLFSGCCVKIHISRNCVLCSFSHYCVGYLESQRDIFRSFHVGPCENKSGESLEVQITTRWAGSVRRFGVCSRRSMNETLNWQRRQQLASFSCSSIKAFRRRWHFIWGRNCEIRWSGASNTGNVSQSAPWSREKDPRQLHMLK